ncbi:TonB-dependent receptor [Sphingopyxis lindanitolerans]|nr:TonB-dependent receptor [Sphingopyxis lindanitolerans]
MKETTQFMSRSVAAMLATTILCTSGAALAQDASAADGATTDGEIVVTAQKREQNLQDVPISIQALGESRLENAQVSSFDDYQKLLPSVSSQSYGPSQTQIVFRGVTSGSDGLQTGSLPTSSVYIDEIPVTTIYGSVDFHVYDVARVEALSGPQGTLFGASSLSGTLRIITNKPDTSGFSGAIDAQVNKFGKGDFGGSLEGYLNLPLSPAAALRVVGFYQKDGGYIDNIPGTRTFTLDDADPDTNLTVDNHALVKNDYNDVETYGGRIALGVDLDEDWTVTPQFIYQRQLSHGGFLFDPRKGDLNVTDYFPSRNLDRWYQAALTVEGKVGNWDLVYSGGYFERKVDSTFDYSYYTVAYDSYGYYANYYPDGNGGFLDPQQRFYGSDHYTKQTHELRISSPSENRFRLTAGMFYQRQSDTARTTYDITGIGSIPPPIWATPFPASTGDPDTIFMTRVFRVDKDYALFAQGEYDILPNLTLSAGVRGFRARNSIVGFSGIATGSSIDSCVRPSPTPDKVCINIDKHTKQDSYTYKLNLSWNATPDLMLYATLSSGFRPGGNNRRADVDPFKADKLYNHEIGWKLGAGRFTFNGAAFYQKWKNMQFGLVPLNNNGVTNIYNAGDANIYGIESDVSYRVDGLSLIASMAYTDARLGTDFCEIDPATLNIVCRPGVAPAAPKGTRLPVQPKVKGTLTARYEFPAAAENKMFVQASMFFQGGTRSFLTDADFAAIGPTKGFVTFDLSAGTHVGNWKVEAFIENLFDRRGELSRNTYCAITFCGPYRRSYPTKPQFFGLKVGTEF